MAKHRALGTLWLLLAVLVPAAPAAAVDWTYTVRPGDSAWSISRRFCREKSCWPAIARYNRLPSVALPRAGRRIQIPVELLSRRPISATAVAANGAVFLRRRGQAEQPLRVGAELLIDDRVRSTAGTATIRFADGSEVVLGEQSELQFDMLGAFGDGGMVDTQIRALRGRLEPRVKARVGGSSFRIVTPTGTAVVRGTEFRIRTEDAQFVELTNGGLAFGSTQLTSGFGLVSKANAPILPPESLLPPARFDTASVTGSAPLQVAWDAVPGATGYRVLLFRTGATTELLSVTDALEPRLALSPPGPGRYQGLVRAIAPSGLEGMDASVDLTILLGAPNLMQEADLATGFRWDPVPNATAYVLQTARDPEFKTALSELQLNDDHYTMPFAPGSSWLRLRAQTTQGDTAFSQAFEVRQTPPRFELTASPRIWDTNAWQLQWRSTPNTRTRLQFAPDARFGSATRELVTDLQGESGLSLLCPFRRCSVRARAEYPAQSATDAATGADAAVAGPWSGTVELRNWLFGGVLRADD